MRKGRKFGGKRNTERGITLFIVAAALVVLLGMAALAIDLASLYVGRNEAQRAADAAALAGAKAFVDTGFTSGLVTQAVAQNIATQRAIAAGGQNTVGGQPAQIQSGDVTFNFSTPENPRVTVIVQRTSARGNAMPVFFAKIFGVLSSDVSAQATAEAYNPSGSASNGGPPVCTQCLKPVVLPNCDPDLAHLSPAPNSFCPGFGKFVDPSCQTNASYPRICHPGPVSQGGVIGMPLLLRPGVPSQAPAPSQYYSLAIGGSGANTYRTNLEACSPSAFGCGNTLNLETGDMTGPTKQGFQDLIHQPGQDTINTSTGLPFTITGGSSNPNPALQNQPITSSDSIVTVPLYDGHNLCPGGSCGSSVTIVGYLQMFIVQVSGRANVTAVILNVSGCGNNGGSCGTGGSGGGSGGTVAGGGSLFPIRLVRNPGT